MFLLSDPDPPGAIRIKFTAWLHFRAACIVRETVLAAGLLKGRLRAGAAVYM